jgi:hypothetical protein
VLTGILPYGDSEKDSVVDDIRRGKRPPRPRDPSQDQGLQDRVWDTIATCWNNEPADRYELSVVYDIFSTPGPQDTQNAKSDKPEQRIKIIPRIASLFQSLRNSKPEIERIVDEMDKVGPSTIPSHPMADGGRSV